MSELSSPEPANGSFTRWHRGLPVIVAGVLVLLWGGIWYVATRPSASSHAGSDRPSTVVTDDAPDSLTPDSPTPVTAPSSPSPQSKPSPSRTPDKARKSPPPAGGGDGSGDPGGSSGGSSGGGEDPDAHRDPEVQFTVTDVSKREPAADGHIVVQVDVAYAQPSHRASVVVHWQAMGEDVGTQQKVFKGPGHFTAEFVYDYSACDDPHPDGLPHGAYVVVSSSNPDAGIPAQEVEMPGYLCNG